jgi:hypothetical protein
MTDMSARIAEVFGPRFMLAIVMAAFAGSTAAQEAAEGTESFEPAVDTSAGSAAAAAERDVLQPGVTAESLAGDVTREQSGSRVMDRLELGRTEITGNQELPKVLYIVPWQKSDPGDLMGRPVNTLLDEVLAPLDREEFNRQVDYYDDLYGDEQ